MLRSKGRATPQGGELPSHKKWPVFPAIRGVGGAEGDRTLDLCIANAALSQLSYRPEKISKNIETYNKVRILAGPAELTAAHCKTEGPWAEAQVEGRKSPGIKRSTCAVMEGESREFCLGCARIGDRLSCRTLGSGRRYGRCENVDLHLPATEYRLWAFATKDIASKKE